MWCCRKDKLARNWWFILYCFLCNLMSLDIVYINSGGTAYTRIMRKGTLCGELFKEKGKPTMRVEKLLIRMSFRYFLLSSLIFTLTELSAWLSSLKKDHLTTPCPPSSFIAWWESYLCRLWHIIYPFLFGEL